MRILTKYILKEILSHAIIGTVLFTFVIFMRDVGRILEPVVRSSAPLPSVAEIFFLTLPTAFTITIPMGVLVGILIGLSRLATDSEITAMRASGMGAGTFVRIISIFSLAMWLVALANTLVIAPRSAAALTKLQNSLKASQASFEVQPRIFYEEFKDYVLYVQDTIPASKAAIWKNVFLADVSTPGAPKITLASQAVVLNEGNNTLRLHLKDGAQHETVAKAPEQYSISTFDETDLPIALPEEPKVKREAVPVAELSTAALLQQSHDPDPSRALWYWIEFHRRLALPASCLVLTLVGIPLGLSAKKGGKSTGFVLTLLLVFIYYFLSLTGLGMAREGKLPPVLGVWLANLVFTIGGMALLWRVDRMPIEIGSIRAGAAAVRRRFTRLMETNRGELSLRRRLFNTRFPLILDDYILRDFIKYLLLIVSSFCTLMLVFTFFELVRDIIRNRVPLITVGQYLVNVLPSMLYLMTPLSVLLAVLVTFGLMQKANEITAMKATGISVYRAIVPVLVVCAAIAVGLFFFDQLYVPHANKRQEVLRNTIKGKPAQTYLRPDRKWIFGQKSTIYYYEFFDPDHNTFGNVSAFEFDPATFQITRRVFAARAHWEEELQKWVFEQGWTRSLKGNAIADFKKFEVSTFDELNEPPSYFKKEVRQSSEMSYGELRAYINDLQQSGFDVVRLRVQLHKKFAFPVITFVMAVLAVPFSLAAARKGALSGVAIAIAIAVAYWVTSGLFEAMGNVNQLPAAVAAWAPDAIFGLAGGYLVLKVPT